MKNLQKTLFLLLLSFICSCTSDEQFQDFSNVKDPTKVTAILPDWNLEDEDSRTSITTGSYPTAPSPVWVTGDSIGIYPDTGGDQLSFRINEGGSKTCTFDGGGWAMKSASYTAYSPFERGYYYEEKDALPISLLGQTQNGNDNADHLGAYDIQIAKGEKPESGGLVFEFSRKVALVRLEITAPKAATWISVSIESDALFTTEAKMNLKLGTPTVTPITTSNSVTLNLENVSTTNDNLSIIAYMMLLPVDLTGKSLSVKLIDSENNIYSNNATITNNKTNFAANAARWVSVIFEEEVTDEETYKDGVVNLTEAGTMKKLLGDDYLNITSLKIIGPINGDDIRLLRNMAGVDVLNQETEGQLRVLDLSDAEIVEGGDYYATSEKWKGTDVGGDYYMYTKNNIFGPFMFSYSKLTEIKLPSAITEIGNLALFDCNGLTKLTIPNTVTTMGVAALMHCDNITEVVLPKNLTVMRESMFRACASLKDIPSWPSNITNIPFATFAACNSFVDIVIPDNIINIEERAFWDCTKMQRIDIPTSVASIGAYAFQNCNSLEKLVCYPTTPPTLGASIFYNIASTPTLYVPYDAIDLYKSRNGWYDYYKNSYVRAIEWGI